MKFLGVVASLVMVASSASVVLAADLGGPDYGSIKDEPRFASRFSWSGGYVGAHGGYAWGKFSDVGNPAADSKEVDGGFGGIQAGYNWHTPSNFVFGVEADASLGGPGREWLGHSVSGSPHDPYYGSDEVEYFGTVRARVGYAFGKFLPYLTGGMIWSSNKHSLGCDRGVAPGGSLGCRVAQFESSKSDLSLGWVVGGGFELALDDRWSFKTEYLYGDIGTGKVNLTDPNYPAVRRDFDGHMNLVRAGLNYRF